ncbi:hypothetical protein KM043_003592 [Ampulex compressa]|nr:hypothetical protein KM043_003592 [Ampulex compressa]
MKLARALGDGLSLGRERNESRDSLAGAGDWLARPGLGEGRRYPAFEAGLARSKSSDDLFRVSKVVPPILLPPLHEAHYGGGGTPRGGNERAEPIYLISRKRRLAGTPCGDARKTTGVATPSRPPSREYFIWRALDDLGCGCLVRAVEKNEWMILLFYYGLLNREGKLKKRVMRS